ncbi:uncharacterized protein O3C94_015204 [Discoglossus pictus]
MPNCIVRGCPHSTKSNSISIGVTLHPFPYNHEKIKQWLRQTGQNFGNLDVFAQCVMDKEKYNSFRLCSVHFDPGSYVDSSTKIDLRSDAIPTIFPDKNVLAPTDEGIIHALAEEHQVEPQEIDNLTSRSVCMVNASTDTCSDHTMKDKGTATDPYHGTKNIGTHTNPFHGMNNSGMCTDPYYGMKHTSTHMDHSYRLKSTGTCTNPKFGKKSVGTCTFILNNDVGTSTDYKVGMKNAYTWTSNEPLFPQVPTAEKTVQWPEYEQNFEGEIWKIKHDHFYVTRRPEPVTVTKPKPVVKEDLNDNHYEEPESDSSMDNTFIPKKAIKEDPDYMPEEAVSDTDTFFEEDVSLNELGPILEKLVSVLKMNKRRRKSTRMTETILNNALEIIYMLTGEEYSIVRNNDDHINSIRPWTGEVPVKFGDLAVYFSMDEWEYIEEHKDQYKDILMEDHHTWTICADGSMSWNVGDEPNTEVCTPYWSMDDQARLYPEFQGEELPNISSLRDEENYRAYQYEQSLFASSLISISGDAYKIPKEEARSYEEQLDRKPDDEDDLSTDYEGKLYNCNECGRQFKFKYWFTLHQKQFPGEKPFQCHTCGEFFISQCDFIAHRRLHSKNKLHQCNICGKNFGLKRTLVEHRKLHNKEKPYECSDCKKRFTTKYYLVVHKRIHTGEKPHACSECDKTFSSKQALNYHEIIHTGQKFKSKRRRSRVKT